MKIACISRQKLLYKTRKERLEIYLKSANGVLAKMYWMGRLDELRVFGKSPENGQKFGKKEKEMSKIPVYPKFKKASDALIAARKLISNPKRWTIGELAVTRDGDVCNTKAKEAEAFCALGAVERVNGPAQRSAVAFLRHAGMEILDAEGEGSYPKGDNSNIFDVNDASDDMTNYKRVLRMFSLAIKAAKKAGK